MSDTNEAMVPPGEVTPVDVSGGAAEGAESAGKRRISPVSVVITALLGLSIIAAVIVLIMLGVLPVGTLALAIGAEAIVGVGLGFLLLSSGPAWHRVRFWISVVLAVVVIAGNVAVVKGGIDWLRFTHDIQAPANETVRFDLVVLTDGPTEVSQLSNSLMGEVDKDEFSAAVHDRVGELVEVDFVPFDSWSEMVTAVSTREVTSMVIQDAFMQILEEADPETYATLTILESFDIDSSLAVAPKPSRTPTPTPTPTPTQAPSSAFVVYISGIDTPGPIENRARSDVNILMVVNPTTGKVLLVNTPRDFYVQLRGTSGLPDKLTHGGVYGIDVSQGTLEDLYGITINYFLRVNFSSLITVVDALGGVDVNSDYAFTARGYSFVQGMNHMDGEAALAFSRERYSFAAGDRTRGQNQERVIEGIIAKLSDPSVLLGYDRILSAVQTSVETSMPQDVISAQIQSQLASGRSWQVTSTAVDGTGAMDYTYSYPHQELYVMIPDQATVDAAKAQIQQVLTGA